MTSVLPAASAGRRRHVLLLPPIPWLPDRRAWSPESGPDMAALERCLADEGFDCTIVDPTPRPWNPFAGRHPLLQGIDPLRALRVLFGWRKVDVVLTVFEGPPVLFLLLRKLFRFRPRLLMWDIGITDDWRLRQWIQRFVVRRLDGIFVLGTNQEGEIAARWSDHAPVAHIGHYTDTDFFRPESGTASEVCRTVFSVGDDEGRDYETLFAAARGLDVDMSVRTHRQWPADFNPGGRIKLLRERVSFPALRQLYADATVVALPMARRPHPSGVSSLLEAAAMGCAIVVSDSPGIRDWCDNGETCLVVPCGDAAALAAAIQRLLDDPPLRARLGANARAFAERECSTRAFARRLALRLAAAIDA